MLEIILKLVVATVFPFFLGLFLYNGRTARIFAFVGVGSTLVTITSIYFFQVSGFPWYADPGRLSAQIVSALGFIGAGFIWLGKDKKIRGLNKAAALWIVAILGIIIGMR
ncbi:MgtC family protein [Thermosyntropha lipolytica DSM 11003]|uniref:MgtC family protein n=1 Tax=Thermosyntropha lipolytica DSM 11003 TaxID=1123382 RepID=A0A1M5KU15_9FIRM|nr:MgtC/SapB family protein [Thermosyntropha lipolytica]SHG56257.1 MgtC family protein [Thermosyntropha lipolytica DSM 11003]